MKVFTRESAGGRLGVFCLEHSRKSMSTQSTVHGATELKSNSSFDLEALGMSINILIKGRGGGGWECRNRDWL